MRNLRSANEFAAQRKKRNIWRNVVTCIAAFVVFCTTYALILPAITMEKEDLSCGLEEHAHSSACYQLTCGKQEVYSHTHTKDNCYNSDGALICTLREQIAHHHTQDCYSKPQPACGQVEHAAHTHGDDCYTDGELTCILAETQGHTHSDACYPADFTAQPVCGKQDLPEHRHSDACYIRVCGKEEHAHTDACADSHQAFIENLDQLAPTADDQPTASEAVTQPEATGAEASEAPTETEAATPPEAQTEAPTEPEATDREETETPTQEETEGDAPEQTEAALLLAAPRMASDGNPEKLVDVATSVTVSGTNVDFDKDKQRYNAGFSVKFKFAVKTENGKSYIVRQGQTEDCGTEFIMSLGELKITDSTLFTTDGHPLRDGGNTVGRYFFEKDSEGNVTLRIRFTDENYIASASEENGIGGTISMSGNLGKKEADSEGKITYPVDGDVNLIVDESDITYPEGVSSKGDMSLSKHGSYSTDGKKLTYTVSVGTTNGTPGKIRIEDVLNLNGLSVSALESVKVNGRELDNSEYTYSNGGSTQTISMELDKLEQWGRHSITYVYTLSEAPENSTLINNKVKATTKPDEGGTEIKLERESNVTVTPDQTPTNPTDPSETNPTETQPTTPTTPTTPPTPDMWKSNNWSDGSKNGNKTIIPWVITVNNNRANVAGMTLSDTMLSQRLRDDAHLISVKVNWGNELTDPNDYSQYLTINDDGTITFKALEEGKNTNCYIITYYTDAGNLGDWGEQSVSNTAIFGEKTSTSTVDETGGNLEKKTDNVYLGDDNRIHMDWTAIITLGKDGILLDQKIADFTLPYGEDGSGKHYYTPGSIQLTYNGQPLDSSYFEAKLFAAENGQETTQDATYMEITMRKDPSQTIGAQESGNKLVLTYSTYAKQEELNGNGNWKNKVAYRSESKISEANITPPSFQKTDGNNQSNTTSLTNVNGDLEWKVKTTLSSISKTKTLVITDYLPEHVHVLELSIQSHAPGDNPLNAQLAVDDNGNIAGSNDEYAFSGTCKKEDGNASYTVRLTVASLTTGAPLEPETTFTLKLKCRIDEDYLAANASSTFTNRADGTVEEGSLGSDEQTQEWTRQEVSPVEGALSKYAKRYTDENGNVTAWNRSDQTLDYVLEINPDGKDIQPGSSKVYLVDEFTYRPQGGNNLQLIYNLVQSSVKLYYAKLGEDGTPLRDASGNLIAGDAVRGGWRWTADEDSPDSDYNATWITKFIRLEVPDATPLILYYSYQLEHHNEEIERFQLNAKNKAYFLAYPDQAKESDQTQTDWKSTTTTGEVYTGRSLTITKMEEGNSNVVIKGAQFKVYKAVQDESGAWQWSSEPLTLTSTDDNHTVREYYETDYNGRLMVKFEDGYETNVLYKLVETKAADGYFLPDSPPTVKFYFKDDTNTTVQLPDAYLLQDAKNLSKQSIFEDIYNTPNDANFSVEKVWMDSFGNNVTKSHSGSVTFELVQLASETKQDTSVVDPLLNTAKVTVKIGAHGDIHYTKSDTLPKGSVVTVRITVPDGATPEARTYVTGNGNHGDFYTNSVTVPAIRAGNTYTFQITVTHNINFEVHGKTNWDNVSGYSCTVAMPSSSSSGSGEAMQFEPKVVDTITLSDSNGWHWSSVEHKGKVPLHGVEYDEAGNPHNVWYTYYVREISGGYDPVYSNWDAERGTVIGLSTGTITVTNTLPPPPEPAAIEIQKQWSGLGELENEQVNFRLIRKQWDHEPTAEERQTHEELAYDDDLSGYPELSEIGQYTLTKTGGWKWSSENVVTLDSYYNGKWYTYFIIEEPGNYSVTYPKEISSGTLTVINTTERKPTSIEVDKQWFDYFGKDVTQDRQGKISFELRRVTKLDGAVVEGSDTLIGTYDVSQASIPAWKWSSEKEGLILYSEEMIALTEGTEKVKVTYEYYVKELEGENASEKYDVTYEGDYVSSGTITIKNTLESPKYELPKTGGTGTLAYTLAGLLLTLTSALALTQKRRKGVS